jgi:hypothetical protein
MIPTGLRHPSLTYVSNSFYLADFVNNLILYLPLGIALSGSSLMRAFLYGLFLSTGAEILQLGYVDRIPSLVDITSNTCGAVAGYLLAKLCFPARASGPRSLELPGPVAAAAAIPLAILGMFVLLHHRTTADFSNWNPGFHLAVGNELTGDRPWVGTISEFAIYPFAMSASQIDDLASRPAGSEPAAKTPAERAIVGPMQAADLTGRFGRPLLSNQQELGLYDTLVKRNQFTLLVSLRTNNVEQRGPARIVTYSGDTANRNFTLGQIRDTLTFRLRTPASGPNGVDPALYSGPVLSLNKSSFVAAVYDGRVSRLYVGGKAVAQADLGAKRPRLPRRLLSWLPGSLPLREIELVGAEILLSGLLAIGVFGLCGVPGRPFGRFLMGAAAGAAVGSIVWIFAVSQPRLGARMLVECIAAGLVISASVVTQRTNGDEIGSPGKNCSAIFTT